MLARLFSYFSILILAVLLTAVISAGITLRVLRGSTRIPTTIVETYRSMMVFPDTVLHLWSLMRGNYKYSSFANSAIQANWKQQFPAAEDPGFLLLPQFDPAIGNVTVSLLRLSDGATALQWLPRRQSIPERAGVLSNLAFGDRLDVLHPLLLLGGDIVAHAAEGLLRLSPCASQPVWFLDRPTHHSIELTPEGNIVTSALKVTDQVGHENLQTIFEDNTLLTIDMNGRPISETSFAAVLEANSMLHLLYNRAGMQMNTDPIHLNQITPAKESSDYWQKGDLLISARHLSMLFIYRPSTDKVIWKMEGHWLNQHSAQFISDHEIVLLDNNYSSLGPKTGAMSPQGTNKIKVYNFRTGEISEPFEKMMEPEHPFTPTQGRVRVLPDGLYFEETDTGRMLRWQNGKLLWSHFSKTSSGQILGGGWSRYYTREEVAHLLPNLELGAKTFASCTLR